jgi:rRNA maturation RNase YbeY
MGVISFNTEGVAMPAIDAAAVRKWIERVASTYGRTVGEVNYIFCSDERILEVNREFLHHDYYTDHIGFDYSVDNILSGDLFLSLDTIRSNAEQLGEDYSRELHRVIIHGILHLVGLKDKTPSERREMESAEDAALEML